MFDDDQRSSSLADAAPASEDAVGKRPLTAGLVQRKARGGAGSEGAPASTDADLATASHRAGLDSFGFALPMQMKAEPEGAPEAAGGGGNGGLPAAVQAKMENAFGADFSDVQIHANSGDATAMGALAYTQGSDVHFAPGQFDPHSSSGQELIGHELSHVVQQREGRVEANTTVQGKGVNDSSHLEHEADVQGALAAQGKFATSSAASAGSGGPAQRKVAQRKVTQLKGGVIQRKEMTSFPPGMTEEELLAGGKGAGGAGGAKGAQPPAQAKMAGGGGPVQMRSAGGVVQMRGGPTVGRLCIVSNAVNDGLLAGHAWLSYTPTGGSETTYGTWGNLDPIGLYRDREVGQAGKARRCTDVDAADVAKLDSFANANNSWSYTNNCSSFAARGWLHVTGESIAYTSMGIPNPSALGAGIQAAGGTLNPGDPQGSSNSSGSSYGSSSLGSARPGSSQSSGS